MSARAEFFIRRIWAPAMIEDRNYARRPKIGALVESNRRPWRVIRIDDVDPLNWRDEERDYWVQSGKPDPATWERRPFRIVGTPDGNDDPDARRVIRVGPRQYASWTILPEHYAVCVRCGELAPCRTHEAERQARAEMKIAEKRMAVMDGCCPGCAEPISTRQKTIVFPGPNLWNPLGSSPVVFHERRKCRGWAERYENDWVAAEPSRKRTWLTAFCEGTHIVHNDGFEECVGTGDADCPGLRCQHRAWTRCYAQSHGCGRCQTGGPNGE